MITKKVNLRVPCDCGCSIIEFARYDDDEEILLTCFASSFYEKQNGIFEEIKQRIVGAWYMLIGKEYRLYDLVISRSDFYDLIDGAKNL